MPCGHHQGTRTLRGEKGKRQERHLLLPRCLLPSSLVFFLMLPASTWTPVRGKMSPMLDSEDKLAMEVPIETRFKVLCEIVRAQHFAWREAVLTLAPDLDPVALGRKMWEITAAQTARAYLKRLDPEKPLALQVANAMAWSSICMGEEAVVEAGQGDEAFLRHVTCPWYDWHKRLGILKEDQPGCDTWFSSTVHEINKELGTTIKIETQCSLPSGADCCLRRIWVE